MLGAQVRGVGAASVTCPLSAYKGSAAKLQLITSVNELSSPSEKISAWPGATVESSQQKAV